MADQSGSLIIRDKARQAGSTAEEGTFDQVSAHDANSVRNNREQDDRVDQTRMIWGEHRRPQVPELLGFGKPNVEYPDAGGDLQPPIEQPANQALSERRWNVVAEASAE